MRHILLLVLALSAFIIVAITPWATLQQTLTTFITPAAQPGACPALAPSPNYYASGGETAAIAAIDHARTREGLPRLTLPDNYWQLAPAEQQFILVNLERASRGLAPLRWDATLAQIATAYSRQMAQLHFFAHTSPISGDFQDRLNANPQIANHYQSIAENIAGNWVPAAGAIYEYLYNDDAEHCAHRQNILNPTFTFIGIGAAPGGPWHIMSAQELLASNLDNPYSSAPPDTTPPKITLTSVLTPTATTLTISASASDNQGVASVMLCLDSLNEHCHQGTYWMLGAGALTPGRHQVIGYAVDASQNYASATLAFTLTSKGFTLHK